MASVPKSAYRHSKFDGGGKDVLSKQTNAIGELLVFVPVQNLNQRSMISNEKKKKKKTKNCIIHPYRN